MEYLYKPPKGPALPCPIACKRRPLCGQPDCDRCNVPTNFYPYFLEHIVKIYLGNPSVGNETIARCCRIDLACLPLILQQPEARKIREHLLVFEKDFIWERLAYFEMEIFLKSEKSSSAEQLQSPERGGNEES